MLNARFNDLIQYIDLTNLSDDISESALIDLCRKSHAENYKVAALCVKPKYITFCKKHLAAAKILVATTINFPYGNHDSSEIFDDISSCLSDGADELDIVIPLEKLKNINNINQFKDIITSFVAEIRNRVTHTLKFIISTDVLKDPVLIKAATEAVILGQGDYVKTCTGMTGGGATIEAINSMLEVIAQYGNKIGVKASGGIKTHTFANEIFRAVEKCYGQKNITSKNFRLGASSLLDDLLLHRQEKLR